MSKVYEKLKNTAAGKQIVGNQRYRIVVVSTAHLIINILYALGNFVLGIYEHSYWFITAGTYYTILGVMRISAIIFERKNIDNYKTELFVQKFSGIMLIGLSFVLSGSVYLSVNYDITSSIHEIIMITIATYTFAKIKKLNFPLLATLRNISLSDASVSIFSMQRSMLVSFEGMTKSNIKLMNILTGTGVCLIVAILGVSMIIKSKKEI